jgi:hypothetical protein
MSRRGSPGRWKTGSRACVGMLLPWVWWMLRNPWTRRPGSTWPPGTSRRRFWPIMPPRPGGADAGTEKAQETLRRMAADWGDLVVDVPLLASWCRAPGQAFDAAVRALASEPESSRVVAAREAFSSGTLTRLRRCWERAAEHERSARRLRAEFMGLPAPTDRIRAWREECPEQGLLHLADGGDGWLATGRCLGQA